MSERMTKILLVATTVGLVLNLALSLARGGDGGAYGIQLSAQKLAAIAQATHKATYDVFTACRDKWC